MQNDNKTIDRDIPCPNCSYNLRGLRTLGNCPECGTSVAASITAARRAIAKIAASFPEVVIGEMSRQTGLSEDGLRFVRGVLNQVVLNLKPNDPEPSGQLNAKTVSTAFRDLALNHFRRREKAIAAIKKWGIESSEDLGELVIALGEAGVLPEWDVELYGDFAGLFETATLFS